ncbi:MAG: chain length determinant protein EpsF [Burkholderiales bacterium]|nr:chain length determinant protein EpsF [Burkholderiales bacterium]
MTLGQFLSVLRARWWVVLLVLALTVGTTVAVSLLLPKQYTASASVVVDFKPDPVSAVVFGGMPSPAVMATQVDILNSERVAMRVVRNLRLADNPDVRAQWQEATEGEGTIEQWLIALFRKSLLVEPSRESSVINVAYTAPDPRFAAGLANAFVEAYTQTSLELRVDPARQFSGFFDVQLKEHRDRLESAQNKLSAYQKQHGIIASDERLDVETQRLNELSSQLVALQAVAAGSVSRQAQAQGAADQMQELLNNPLLNNLKAEIGRIEARLQELSSRLGDRHPQVVETRATLDALQKRFDAESRRVAGGVRVTSNIDSSRVAQARTSMDAQRERVLRMKAVRDEGMLLQRDVESAQRAYDNIQARQVQTNLESQTTQSSVHTLTQAVPPVEPSSPNLLLNTALAIFLGSLLAVGTALLLELLDRRVRNADDVVAALDLPVIGFMPKPGGNRKRASMMQQRLLAPARPALPQS